MSNKNQVHCTDCIHFRSAPYQARIAGCFLESNMPGRQKDAYLNEQQIPGNHEIINLRGDCADFEAPKKKPGLLTRMFTNDS
ncbi:MAG: hypothetical protein ACI8TQ_002671 [Planctomycetota bacterium]|jgi:hypothetical protein